jgi:hypothetical protein
MGEEHRRGLSPLLGALIMMGALGAIPRTRQQEEEIEFERMVKIEKESKTIQQLHRFVIRGQEIWARNKKDALKQASRRT